MSVLRFLFIACALLLTPPALAQPLPGPSDAAGPPNVRGDVQGAEIWRQIRRGEAGEISLPGRELGILIQSEGEEWRARRNGPLMTWGGWLLTGVLLAIVGYFAVRGRIRIRGGRSGQRLSRFDLGQRIAHWSVAALFVLLGLSGMILLFGKIVLTPLIGKAAFAAVASAGLQAHNLFGPLFVAAIVLLFWTFRRRNGFRRVDLAWLVRGGSFFGGHPSSGFYNFGEKLWFWWAIVFGLALSASGLLLDFPWLADRQSLQFANLVHAASAVLSIAFGLGHAYLGTVGIEGALEGMTEGTGDANWARQHHDLGAAEHNPAGAGRPAE